ncbi:putative protein N(5)-glutamine methyltransferase [Cellulomonas marina]|uniref:peptide chain release factor N(5)-glutamine methyltransferase n=1 Tax=Cellulomonas marina TaxID=988821 RepID=A0A1I0YGJ0_9CELL|nr:putative protein N(5)-glutamine methyltransferase [Cellulomonas marina]GIG28696.1 methylase [Cellulomonas marina]SFB12331.1 release factor glutamine methyltransferase [Cellulomonas marina]
MADVDTLVRRLRAAGCVFAEDEAALLLDETPDPDELERRTARRVGGEPLEQVLGWAAFAGLRVHVEPGVFVPRRRSELLVTEAVARVRPGAVVADLCCGTGAVGLAVATAVPGVDLHAVDLDPVAVRCARRNLAAVGGHVHAGDVADALPVTLLGGVDVVVANAPYVPTAAIAGMPPEARDHEPAVALDGGVDGVDVQRRVVAAAARWLRPGGTLLVETGEDQVPLTAAAFAAHGFDPVAVRDEEHDATVVVGTLRADHAPDRPAAPQSPGDPA